MNIATEFEERNQGGLTILRATRPLAYQPVWELQKRIHREVSEGERPETLIILEHTPVITLGRNAPFGEVKATPELLSSLGVSVHRIERGGQATFHGPGQLVAYPILNLRKRNLGVKKYVHLLEDTLIGMAQGYGVTANRVEGAPGVYHGSQKLGAVGVAIKNGVSLHGVSFNVNTDLFYYSLITPCGRDDLPPTSISRLLGHAQSSESAEKHLVQGIIKNFTI